MKIDGKLIAQEIRQGLRKRVAYLKSKNILPHLAVILVGSDQSSQVYVKQKKKVGEEIGARVTLYSSNEVRSSRLSASNDKEELIKLAKKLNSDPLVHGIIIQRPLPIDITKEELDRLVIPQKDVDGFHPHSPFTPPITLAVLQILNYIYLKDKKQTPQIQAAARNRGVLQNVELHNWLNKKRVLVIGRGETAGKPIADTLIKISPKLTIAHSQTTNMKEVCLSSDIIITCVGRSNIVRPNMVTQKTILIGVGLHPEENKLQTDYNQEEIKDLVAFYTPVPGGVGPVNVACLFENLLKATLAD